MTSDSVVGALWFGDDTGSAFWKSGLTDTLDGHNANPGGSECGGLKARDVVWGQMTFRSVSFPNPPLTPNAVSHGFSNGCGVPVSVEFPEEVCHGGGHRAVGGIDEKCLVCASGACGLEDAAADAVVAGLQKSRCWLIIAVEWAVDGGEGVRFGKVTRTGF